MSELTLYQRVLGERYQELHPLLQEVHRRNGLRAEGTFRIIRPQRWFSRLVGTVLGMPAAAENVPTVLTVTVAADTERWERQFGTYRMATWQWGWKDLLLERSGPVTFGIHLDVTDGGMMFIVRRVWILGLPMPLAISPSVSAMVTPLDGGWHAKVELRFPLLGEMLGYEGEIYPIIQR